MPDRRLIVEDLRKTYRGNWLIDSTRALDGVSFDVRAGECLGVLGPNGAGKSTTFKICCGLVRQTSGSVLLFGLPPRLREARERLGYLPENAQFHDFLTGEELVDLAARLAGVPAAERARRVAETLDRVGLGAARVRRIRTYSKGMVQRVGIAQAIVGRPELVILDEPMTGLDPVGRREVRNLIGDLAAQGAALVFSTHVLQDVELACDRVLMLAAGRVLRAGTLADLLGGREGPVEVTVRDLPAEDARQAAEAAGARRVGSSADAVVYSLGDPRAAESFRAAVAARGGRVVALVPQAASLEDVFLEELAAARGGKDG